MSTTTLLPGNPNWRWQ